MLEKGYLCLGGKPGLTVRLHWSIPVGGLVLTSFHLSAGAWAGFALLLLVHILGHAAMVVASGVRLTRIDVHGLGGHCAVVGLSRAKRMLVASGGVLAQLAVLALVVLVLRSPGDGSFTTDLLDMFVGPSLLLAGLNVLPIAPLDGADVWKLPRTLADMDDDDPESFDKPRRENAPPPQRDWFARVRARSRRAQAADEERELDANDADEAALSKEAEEEVERVLRNATGGTPGGDPKKE